MDNRLTGYLDALCRCPLFSGISRDEAGALLEGKGSLRALGRGQPMDGYGGRLGIVLRGTLMVTGGSGTPLNRLETGALFGVSTVFTEQKNHVTDISAGEDSLCLLLDEGELQGMFAADQRVSRNYLCFLTGRIRFLNWKIDLFTASTAGEKLLCWLRHQCFTLEDGQKAALLPPMAALAGQLGMSRASLYRAVTALEEAGIIRRASRKEWIIHFPVPEKGGGMPENK